MRRVLCLLALLASLPALAGGPRSVNGLGQPMAWPAGSVTYHPDLGPLGSLSNPEARSLLTGAFGEWASVGALTFTEGSLLAEDINATDIPATNTAHYKHFWRRPDCTGDRLAVHHGIAPRPSRLHPGALGTLEDCANRRSSHWAPSLCCA